MKKNVLILSPFFPPRSGAGVYRWAKFCKYINELGWTPSIITAPISDNDKLDYSLWNEIKDNIKVIYPCKYPCVKSQWYFKVNNTKLEYVIKGIMNNTLFIPDYFIRFLPQFAFAGIRACRKQNIDAIVATGSPFSTFFIGTLISKFIRVPLVLDFRDLWVDDYFIKIKKPHIKIIMKWMESYSVKNASAVISVTDDMTQLLQHKYNTFKNIVFYTITNGYDDDDFDEVVGQAPNEHLCFCHVGTWNAAHPLENFFKALQMSFDQKPNMRKSVRVVLCGPINSEKSAFIHDMGLSNSVIYKGQVDHKEAIKIMLYSDIEILSLADLEQYSGYYSGKIFEYLRAKKQVLAIVPEGVAANLIRKFDIGAVIDPNNIIAISKKITEYHELFLNKCTIGTPKTNEYLQKIKIFSRRSLSLQLVQVLDNL